MGKGISSTVEVYPVQPGLYDATSIAIKLSRGERLSGAISTEMWREVSLLTRLEHPNVVKLLDVFLYPGAMGLVLPAAKGSLVALYSSLSPRDIKNCIFQVLSGLAYIHSRDIVHLDLKPGNVLLYEEPDGIRAVISDFGLSMNDSCSEGHKDLGFTPRFRAPEGYYGARSTPAADIWSFGMMTHNLVTGKHLIEIDKNVDGHTSIGMVVSKLEDVFGTPTEAIWPGVTSLSKWWKYHSGKTPKRGIWPSIDLEPSLKRFLSRIFVLNPSERATAVELLRDDWLFEEALGKLNLDTTPITPKNCLDILSAQQAPTTLSKMELSYRRVYIELIRVRSERQSMSERTSALAVSFLDRARTIPDISDTYIQAYSLHLASALTEYRVPQLYELNMDASLEEERRIVESLDLQNIGGYTSYDILGVLAYNPALLGISRDLLVLGLYTSCSYVHTHLLQAQMYLLIACAYTGDKYKEKPEYGDATLFLETFYADLEATGILRRPLERSIIMMRGFAAPMKAVLSVVPIPLTW